MVTELTEEDGHEGRSVQQLLQHLEVDRLDGVVQLPVVVVQQPRQDRHLVLKITWKC